MLEQNEIFLENFLSNPESEDADNFELVEGHQNLILTTERNYQELKSLTDQLFNVPKVEEQSSQNTDESNIHVRVEQLLASLSSTPESLLESVPLETELFQLKIHLQNEYEIANQNYWRQRMVTQDVSNSLSYLEWQRFERFPKLQKSIRKAFLGIKLKNAEKKNLSLKQGRLNYLKNTEKVF